MDVEKGTVVDDLLPMMRFLTAQGFAIFVGGLFLSYYFAFMAVRSRTTIINITILIVCLIIFPTSFDVCLVDRVWGARRPRESSKTIPSDLYITTKLY